VAGEGGGGEGGEGVAEVMAGLTIYHALLEWVAPTVLRRLWAFWHRSAGR
jgi:hypothetical protein